MGSYENVMYEVKPAAQGAVAYITLNRPERLNALSRDLLRELDSRSTRPATTTTFGASSLRAPDGLSRLATI